MTRFSVTVPLEPLSEVLAHCTYEMGNPHGYGCRVCGSVTTAPPFAIAHDPECEAEALRAALRTPRPSCDEFLYTPEGWMGGFCTKAPAHAGEHGS